MDNDIIMENPSILPRKVYLAKANDVPNSMLPALIYRGVISSTAADKAARFWKQFNASGWSGVWTDTIYDYTHFHSNAHEVLGIAEGKVTIKLGGNSGRLFRLKAGDMLILPAGVGHCRVSKDDNRLKVVGAYPRGQAHYDIKRKGRMILSSPHFTIQF